MEFRIIKRAGLYVVQANMLKGWSDVYMANNPHQTLDDARWWKQRREADDMTRDFTVIE